MRCGTAVDAANRRLVTPFGLRYTSTMRLQRRHFLALLAVLTLAIVLVFNYRRRAQAAFGPEAALCPGPDAYGYTCESGAGYAYIDATHDTKLYRDDGVVPLDLPFPFLFYGSSYQQLFISSNGNLQFGSATTDFSNQCLTAGPAVGMGSMIAPYWDDLDLTAFGTLEYELVGSVPERILAIEWDDVPIFGDDSDDRVTFEVQLFEENNNIVFLYEDASTLNGYNGSGATVGLQSERDRVSLQYGCDQPVIADASAIAFPHPSSPNQAIGQRESGSPANLPAANLSAKGKTAELLTMLDQWGPSSLPQLRAEWIRGPAPTVSQWHWLDLTGDGIDELIMIWNGGSQRPQLNQLAVVDMASPAASRLLLNQPLFERNVPALQLSYAESADLTHDGRQDMLLRDSASGRLLMLTAEDLTQLHTVSFDCVGRFLISEPNRDGQSAITMDGCQEPGRITLSWTGDGFAPIP